MDTRMSYMNQNLMYTPMCVLSPQHPESHVNVMVAFTEFYH
jgi:hypothetical protein